jgi:hypothetical protein
MRDLKIVEFSARVRPTGRFLYASGFVNPIEPRVRIGLQYASESTQMRGLWMFQKIDVAASSSPCSPEHLDQLCPRFPQCGHKQMCPHCTSSSTTHICTDGQNWLSITHKFAEVSGRGGQYLLLANSRVLFEL